MRRVILESPYAGTATGILGPLHNLVTRMRNRAYARACVRDSLLRGEAPIASHLLYTQPGILRDNDPSERQHGIDAGLAWGKVAEASVVYIDRGISSGMAYGIVAARSAGRPVEYRSLKATSAVRERELVLAALEKFDRQWCPAPDACPPLPRRFRGGYQAPAGDKPAAPTTGSGVTT